MKFVTTTTNTIGYALTLNVDDKLGLTESEIEKSLIALNDWTSVPSKEALESMLNDDFFVESYGLKSISDSLRKVELIVVVVHTEKLLDSLENYEN